MLLLLRYFDPEKFRGSSCEKPRCHKNKPPELRMIFECGEKPVCLDLANSISGCRIQHTEGRCVVVLGQEFKALEQGSTVPEKESGSSRGVHESSRLYVFYYRVNPVGTMENYALGIRAIYLPGL